MNLSLSTWFLSIFLALAAVAPVWAVPGVVSLTTPVLPANANRTNINSLTASTGTPTRYNITSMPGGGTLYVNGTAVTAARPLTLTEATQLSFQPSGTAGNYSFNFTATDGTGTSAAAAYALSVGQAGCGQAAGFDFSTRTINESWTTPRSATSSGVTISSSGYVANGTSANRLQVEADAAGTLSTALKWGTTYSAKTPNSSTVTFTFSRALSGFSIVVQDIDANTTNPTYFIDQVQFDGYTSSTATTPITLVAANVKVGTTNSFSGGANCVTGTANSNATPIDNVIVTFPQAITKLTLTYRNTQTTSNTPTLQALSIPSFGWCAEADITTTLTGPARAQAGSQVTYTVTTKNNGPDVPATVTPKLQMPTGLTGLTFTNGGAYDAGTGLVTFPAISSLAVGAAVANSLSYPMPATGSVSATSGFTSTATDLVSTNNTSTLATAQNRAPVANNVTNAPAILSSTTAPTNIASFNASDPDASAGNTTIASYTIASLPTAAQGTLYVNGTAATLNQVIAVPTSATAAAPGYQLSFVPNGTFAGTAAFTYKATDDVGTGSNVATYNIPVTPGADVVTVVNGSTTGVEGQSKTYSTTTTNNGPAAATNIVNTLTLSNNPPFSSVTVANGSYDPTTGVVTFSAIASLASGATVVSSITLVVPPTPASFTVTAASTSGTADPTPANNNGSAAAATLTTAVARIGPAGTASACANPGRDGSSTLTANPNTYYPAANQTVAVGATSFAVGAAAGSTLAPIAAGDLLLVIQMQGADIDATNTDAYGDGVPGGFATSNLNNANFTAGQYEYVVAAGAVPVGGGTVALTTGLKNSYQNTVATTTTGQRRFQVVRIPQYQNLTVSGTVAPSAWDGSTGGILALDVTGKLAFAAGAALDASGKGFRGGAGQRLFGTSGLTSTDYRAPAPASATTTVGAHASKGEGVAGTPRYVNNGTALFDTGVDGYPNGSSGRGAPGNAGGGGTDENPSVNVRNTGGGGGGNGSRGGRGGNSYNTNQPVGGEPGSGFNAPSSSRLIMGGGGGAGSGDNNSGYLCSGAAGGGIVLVRTGSVAGSGTVVLANGASASNAVSQDGGGGGGAGGSILVTANNAATLGSIFLAANGGNGGSNNTTSTAAHGPGGGGGGGIILSNAPPAGTAVAGGTNGLTIGNVPYGAAAGQPGIANGQISNRIAGSTAGINCSTDVTATVAAPASATSGQTVNLSATFANNGGVDAATVTRTVLLASGDVLNPVTGVVAPGSSSISPPDAAGTVTVAYPAISPLAAGTTTTFGISYTAPGTTAVTATAAITTASSEPVTDNNTSATSTAITGYADIVGVIFGLSSSTTGAASANYNAVFANNGPAAAANVTRTVTLPAGATLTAAQLKVITDQSGSYNSSTRVIDFGTLATQNSRDGKVFQFSYTASNTGGTDNIVSRTTATTAEDANGGTGAPTAPDTFPFAVTNNSSADVATASITASAASVAPGQQASFTVNYANYGPGDTNDTPRAAQLTPGLSIVSITGGGIYDASTGIVTYPTISLANGGTASSVITFVAPATGPVNISATISRGTNTVSAGAFGNNQATASLAVTPVADVATTVSGPASAVTGNLVTFSVTTANNGPSPATAVVQTILLPRSLTGVFPSNNGSYDASTGIVTYPALPVLASGTQVNNTVSFNIPGTNLTASAAVTTTTVEATGTTANNTATAATTAAATTTDKANVYTTLTFADQNVAPGGPITFTVGTGNNGPNSALDVVQQISLPPNLSVTSITSGGTYNPASGLVTFPALSSQASGTSVVNTVVLAAPAAGPLVAVASVAAATSDPVPADNVAIRNIDIMSVADVATTIVGPTSASATQVVTFTVSTSNNGPVPAANVVQAVSIPAGFAAAEVTASNGGFYDPSIGVITWPRVASLAVGEVRTYTYSYVAPASSSTGPNNLHTVGSLPSVTSSTPDGNPANNRTAIATEIKWNADISVAVAGPTTSIVGNPVTFSVSTINNGPAPAPSATTTVRIVTGLTNVVVSGGGVYDIMTGIVTFPTVTNQVVGVTGAVTNTITLLVPDRPLIGVAAAVNIPATTNDINLTNNAAILIIPVTPQTSTLVDLRATLAADRTSQQAGQPIVLTVTATNASATTASNMRARVSLPAGLTSVVATNPDGSTLPGAYDAASGVVTFAIAASQAPGTVLTYTVTVNDPGNDPLVAKASLNGNFSDPTPANNTQTVSVNIVPVADVATRISGPATLLPNASATYNILTINNGPSPASAVGQTAQLPTGLASVIVSDEGSYDASSGLVTFPTIATQAVGKAGEVTHTVVFTFPTTAATVGASVRSGTAENAATTANNTSGQTTTLTNQVPLANATANRQQTPEGNTAAPLLLSALNGLDTDGTLASFAITSLPAPAAGVLLLNGSAVSPGQTVSLADVARLQFDPAATFVGNAFFLFTATDNQGAVSAPALYTIAVGQDNGAVYTPTPPKGGPSPYQNGDVIANVFDANGGSYDATAAVADNGVRTAGVNDSSLPAGTQVDPATGQVTVYDRTLLMTGNYSVNITTVDANGGVTTQAVPVQIGAYPLPVELTRFDAKAVGLDGQLSWATAHEQDNRGFQVQRSFDGTLFEDLTLVAGAGNSTQPLAYAFVDAGVGQQHSGTVYYRLQQRDLTGKITYSPVRTVAFGQQRPAPGVTLYPNPAAEQTTLDLAALPAAPYQVAVVDRSGRLVQTHTLAGGQAHVLTVGSLPTGTYVVIVSAGKLKFSQHFIKQ